MSYTLSSNKNTIHMSSRVSCPSDPVAAYRFHVDALVVRLRKLAASLDVGGQDDPYLKADAESVVRYLEAMQCEVSSLVNRSPSK